MEGGKALGSAISNTPSGTVHRWRVLWAAFITYLLDSYDLIVLAIAMPVLLKVLDISLPEGGLIGSATMLGAVVGGVVFGLIAENYGRRFSLILALLWLGICMGFIYFIHTWGMWLVLRFITGIAVGGIWGPCSALIAEHWAPEYRGRAASLVLSSFAIGAVLASFVGRFVLTVDWRFLFLVGASA
ncbi:MAG: MFS transporter [Deltaproteobacteria bacterium]|nr:MFS transporter [Deltaproteobacteria bacterium]